MDSYNFWADLLDTYQSTPDVIKLLIILEPPLFILAMVAMLRIRPIIISELPGEDLYIIHRTKGGLLVALPNFDDLETKQEIIEAKARGKEIETG